MVVMKRYYDHYKKMLWSLYTKTLSWFLYKNIIIVIVKRCYDHYKDGYQGQSIKTSLLLLKYSMITMKKTLS